MPRFCSVCGRQRHKGLCDLVELSDGRWVSAPRVENYDGDVHEQIIRGEVKVINKWIKSNDKKLA